MKRVTPYRTPRGTCRKCRNHGLVQPRHARANYCLYAACSCNKCLVIDNINREQREQTARKVPVTATRNLMSEVAVSGSHPSHLLYPNFNFQRGSIVNNLMQLPDDLHPGGPQHYPSHQTPDYFNNNKNGANPSQLTSLSNYQMLPTYVAHCQPSALQAQFISVPGIFLRAAHTLNLFHESSEEATVTIDMNREMIMPVAGIAQLMALPPFQFPTVYDLSLPGTVPLPSISMGSRIGSGWNPSQPTRHGI